MGLNPSLDTVLLRSFPRPSNCPEIDKLPFYVPLKHKTYKNKSLQAFGADEKWMIFVLSLPEDKVWYFFLGKSQKTVLQCHHLLNTCILSRVNKYIFHVHCLCKSSWHGLMFHANFLLRWQFAKKAISPSRRQFAQCSWKNKKTVLECLHFVKS